MLASHIIFPHVLCHFIAHWLHIRLHQENRLRIWLFGMGVDREKIKPFVGNRKEADFFPRDDLPDPKSTRAAPRKPLPMRIFVSTVVGIVKIDITYHARHQQVAYDSDEPQPERPWEPLNRGGV